MRNSCLPTTWCARAGVTVYATLHVPVYCASLREEVQFWKAEALKTRGEANALKNSLDHQKDRIEIILRESAQVNISRQCANKLRALDISFCLRRVDVRSLSCGVYQQSARRCRLVRTRRGIFLVKTFSATLPSEKCLATSVRTKRSSSSSKSHQ